MDGHLREQLQEMQRIREGVFKELAKLSDSVLLISDPETQRSVRQLISLYFSHERNHIVQIQKTRKGLGSHPTEIQMLLAQAEQSRGDLRASLLGMTDEEWAQKSNDVSWSVQEILTHLMDVENRLLERIRRLVAEKPEG